MARLQPLTSDTAAPAAKPLLEGVQKQLGVLPNMMATMAHAPAALQAYLGFGQALGKGELSAGQREQIALAVAGANSCGYCASAHTLLGKGAGVDEGELGQNLRGHSADADTQILLSFARSIVEKRGHVSDSEVDAVRAAGFSDGVIVEVIAVVALNIFTNYFNHIADTVIDFPVVDIPAEATV